MISLGLRLFARRSPCCPVVASLSTSSSVWKGHSKWQNIKATKGKNDMLKSQALTYLLKKVRIAVKDGKFDPKYNSELASLEKEFRAQGLPLDTFKNFLQKLKDKPSQVFRFEVIGPSGSFFIIETEGPSKSPLESNLRKYFNKVGGFRLAADSAAVLAWFEEKGILRASDVLRSGEKISFEKAEEIGIELDCEQVDLVKGEDGNCKIELTCDPLKVSAVESSLQEKGFVVEVCEVEYRPKHPVVLSGDDAKLVEKLYGYLEEDESINQIYDNIQPEA